MPIRYSFFSLIFFVNPTLVNAEQSLPDPLAAGWNGESV